MGDVHIQIYYFLEVLTFVLIQFQIYSVKQKNFRRGKTICSFVDFCETTGVTQTLLMKSHTCKLHFDTKKIQTEFVIAEKLSALFEHICWSWNLEETQTDIRNVAPNATTSSKEPFNFNLN